MPLTPYFGNATLSPFEPRQLPKIKELLADLNATDDWEISVAKMKEAVAQQKLLFLDENSEIQHHVSARLNIYLAAGVVFFIVQIALFAFGAYKLWSYFSQRNDLVQTDQQRDLNQRTADLLEAQKNLTQELNALKSRNLELDLEVGRLTTIMKLESEVVKDRLLAFEQKLFK